jgi:hypothetical protein
MRFAFGRSHGNSFPRAPSSGSRRSRRACRRARRSVGYRAFAESSPPEPSHASASMNPGTRDSSHRSTRVATPSRSERGILASTNTSWIFLRRPASLSPGLQPRTLRPGARTRSSRSPSEPFPSSATGLRSSQGPVVLRTRLDAVAEIEPLRAHVRRDQVGDRRAATVGRRSRALAGGSRRRPGVSSRE